MIATSFLSLLHFFLGGFHLPISLLLSSISLWTEQERAKDWTNGVGESRVFVVMGVVVHCISSMGSGRLAGLLVYSL